MNESYKELLVKREKGAKENLLRIVCVIPTVLVGLLTLLTGNIILLAITIALGVLDYFVFQWTDIEYEYLYLDKEISVDKIMAKTRRKKVATLDVNKIEIMAPIKSYHLDNYRNRECKIVDLSAGKDMGEQKLYWVYYEGRMKYILNLDDDFAGTVKTVAPRQVFAD